MNVNTLIVSALTPLNYPIAANVYDGTASEYIVFNYADERPIFFADETDLYDSTSVQVHFFAKSNPQSVKKSIRKNLKAAGFIILNTQELYEADTDYTHVIIEAEIEGGIDDS